MNCAFIIKSRKTLWKPGYYVRWKKLQYIYEEWNTEI